MIGLPMAYHALGRKADSDAALAALIAKYEKDCAPTTSLTSTLSAARPIRHSRGSTRRSSTATPASPSIVTENLFDKIHADPRWLPFLRKIGKAPEQLAKIEFKVTLPQ